MQNAEGASGGSFYFERGLRGIPFQMQLFQFGMHDIRTDDADHEETHKQEEIEAVKGAAIVKPFGDKVGESNASTPLMDDEVAIDQNLRRRPGVRLAQ